MKIDILPPDINESEGVFSVEKGAIRYGLNAIKGIGKPVQKSIVEERKRGGRFTSLRDLVQRLTGKEVNKRTLENFIKAGALDSLGGTRKQLMMVYAQVMDDVNLEKKSSVEGQMTLFDMMGEEEKQEYELKLPDVGEYDREVLLGFEKEVLGIYISGHPLEEYEKTWRKNISAVTSDFYPDEDTGYPRVADGSKQTIGGMITEKTIKYTKQNKTMAFLTIEDLVGTVEVVVFPRDYEQNVSVMQEDAKVFIRGRVSAEDDRPSKLICERITPFGEMPRQLWIQFPSKAEYEKEVQGLYDILKTSDGSDEVVLYLKKERAMKKLPPSRSVRIEQHLVSDLSARYGADNVKVVEKSIEKQ